MNGREDYTLLEFLFVLVWPARPKANTSRALVTRTVT